MEIRSPEYLEGFVDGIKVNTRNNEQVTAELDKITRFCIHQAEAIKHLSGSGVDQLHQGFWFVGALPDGRLQAILIDRGIRLEEGMIFGVFADEWEEIVEHMVNTYGVTMSTEDGQPVSVVHLTASLLTMISKKLRQKAQAI